MGNDIKVFGQKGGQLVRNDILGFDYADRGENALSIRISSASNGITICGKTVPIKDMIHWVKEYKPI
jgi:hypothetical protein